MIKVWCRVIDRLAFLLENPELAELGASTVMLMSRAKFQNRFPRYKDWLQQRNAAQHTNAWQASNAMTVLSSLDEQALLPDAVWH